MGDHNTQTLGVADPQVADLVKSEQTRQQSTLELIASENHVSQAVREAQGSCLTNKYAEGYPRARYYGGCGPVDGMEDLARQRARDLFHLPYVNVQPHSGSQANQAAFMACLKPGDTILGMSLDAGGHLTHGAKPTLSGKWFQALGYGVNAEGILDYAQVEALAQEHHPKLIIAGGSSYPLAIDFERFRKIADRVGAILMVDMAHVAGLIAAGRYPHPGPYADIITTTTHKTLRGPRGGMILSRHEDWGKKIDSAVFPGIQGGPLMHVIAAKAVCLGEALQPSFKTYIDQVLENARVLGQTLQDRGYRLVAGGTETHQFSVNFTPQGLTGKDVEASLERAGMIVNKNAIPGDPLGPRISSGIRVGTPALTSRGMDAACMRTIGGWMCDVFESLKTWGLDHPQHHEKEVSVHTQVQKMCQAYPL